MGPTGGFLIGFLLLAAIVGYAADRGASGKPLTLFAAMLVGDAVLFVLGFAWLVLMAGQAQWIDQANVVASAFAKAIQPFIIWDILKMALAALTVTGAWNLLSKR
jgi:biotin transport system substrate-specific component